MLYSDNTAMAIAFQWHHQFLTYEYLSQFAEQLEEIDALRHEREDRFRREKEQRLMIIRLRREKGERERKVRSLS